jgi:hypothetical protein
MAACLTMGAAVGIYIAMQSGPSVENQLIGNWEIDPEYVKQVAKQDPTGGFAANFIAGSKFDFNSDHTFKMTWVLVLDGKWKITSRSDKTLKVSMIPKVFGLDSDPAIVTIVMLDKDHLDFDSGNQKTMSGAKGRFRRVGTGAH